MPTQDATRFSDTVQLCEWSKFLYETNLWILTAEKLRGNYNNIFEKRKEKKKKKLTEK